MLINLIIEIVYLTYFFYYLPCFDFVSILTAVITAYLLHASIDSGFTFWKFLHILKIIEKKV